MRAATIVAVAVSVACIIAGAWVGLIVKNDDLSAVLGGAAFFALAVALACDGIGSRDRTRPGLPADRRNRQETRR